MPPPCNAAGRSPPESSKAPADTHLIKDRLNITGARRSPPGPEAVLKLRALIRKGDFEPYLAWHLQREHQCNHQARYQDKLSLAA